MYLNLSSLGNSDSAEIWGTSASSPELLGTLPATVQCYEEAEEALAEGETSIGSCIRRLPCSTGCASLKPQRVIGSFSECYAVAYYLA